MVIRLLGHYSGWKADVNIFYENVAFRKIALEKRQFEKEILYIGELVEEYENSWAVFTNKGYQGGVTHVRLPLPPKSHQMDYFWVVIRH